MEYEIEAALIEAQTGHPRRRNIGQYPESQFFGFGKKPECPWWCEFGVRTPAFWGKWAIELPMRDDRGEPDEPRVFEYDSFAEMMEHMSEWLPK